MYDKGVNPWRITTTSECLRWTAENKPPVQSKPFPGVVEMGRKAWDKYPHCFICPGVTSLCSWPHLRVHTKRNNGTSTTEAARWCKVCEARTGHVSLATQKNLTAKDKNSLRNRLEKFKDKRHVTGDKWSNDCQFKGTSGVCTGRESGDFKDLCKKCQSLLQTSAGGLWTSTSEPKNNSAARIQEGNDVRNVGPKAKAKAKAKAGAPAPV